MKRLLKILGILIVACLGISVIAAIVGPNQNTPASNSATPVPSVVASPATATVEQPTVAPTAPEPTIGPTDTAAPTEAPTTAPTAAPTEVPTAAATPTTQEALEQIGREECGARFVKVSYTDIQSDKDIATFECGLSDGFSDELIIGAALMDLQKVAFRSFAIDGVDLVRMTWPQTFNMVAPRSQLALMDWKNGVSRKELARFLEANKDDISLFIGRPYRNAWASYIN